MQTKATPVLRVTILSFLGICGLSGHATLLKADIAFSNVTGAGYGFYPAAPFGFGPTGGPNSLGEPFIAGDPQFGATGNSASYLLTDVQVLVSAGGPTIGDSYFGVSIFSDTSGGLPGSFIAGSDSGVASATPGLVTVPLSGPDSVLTSGATYWIIMTAEQGFNLTAWYATDDSYSGGEVYSNLGQGWMPGCCGGPGYPTSNFGDVQFQVDGTPLSGMPPVPEPANLAFLVAIAFSLMALLRLRKGSTGKV